ncbi:hypothetical protein PHLCEN_2v12126 [Hermanssonia centrifuga]|uniref:Uncharacterized protein n=1 Tax=Hermanssonia centrifuga TaxID=98765 RepID=A0A2R6NHP9_9APHY|nr:hypothetical protein PHLCEN_2v12126 [Hermanssonia centrifuga]
MTSSPPLRATLFLTYKRSRIARLNEGLVSRLDCGEDVPGAIVASGQAGSPATWRTRFREFRVARREFV